MGKVIAKTLNDQFSYFAAIILFVSKIDPSFSVVIAYFSIIGFHSLQLLIGNFQSIYGSKITIILRSLIKIKSSNCYS